MTDRIDLIARELDLRQITLETTARTNALNFAAHLGSSHAGNLDRTLQLSDRITSWIMTGEDKGALFQLSGAKPPLVGDPE